MIRALLALALLIAPAQAQLAQTGAGGVSGGGAPSFTGLGDIIAGVTAYYTCDRAYNAAYAAVNGKMCNIVRTSDSEACDELAAANGGPGLTANCTGADNGETLAVFLAATTGAVTKAYNQVLPGTSDVSQATAADQPGLSLSCIGLFPCDTFLAANSQTLNGTITSVAQPFSFSAMVNRNSAFTSLSIAFGTSGQTRVGFSATTNQAYIYAGSLSANVPSSNSVWHDWEIQFNGSSSIFAVDGVQTGSLVAGSDSSGTAIGVGSNTGGFQFYTGQLTEVAYLGAVALSGAQMTAVCQQRQAFYGPANFGAPC